MDRLEAGMVRIFWGNGIGWDEFLGAYDALGIRGGGVRSVVVGGLRGQQFFFLGRGLADAADFSAYGEVGGTVYRDGRDAGDL